MSDYEECIEYSFGPDNNPYRYNPLVADIPKLGISITSPPAVSLHLTDISAVSRAFETSRSDESAQTVVNAEAKAGYTALPLAVGKGHAEDDRLEVVRLLIDAGADVNVRSKEGATALIWASRHRQPDVVSLLIKSGAHVNTQNNDGGTALMYASGSGHTVIV